METNDGVQDPPATPAEASEREATTYVVLVNTELDPNVAQPAWAELGQVTGQTRAAAFERAKQQHEIEPQEVGEQAQMQLVPTRFWRTITMAKTQPAPSVTVDGL